MNFMENLNEKLKFMTILQNEEVTKSLRIFLKRFIKIPQFKKTMR